MEPQNAETVSEGERALDFCASPTWLYQWWGHWKSQSLALVICKIGQLGKTVLWKEICVWRPQFSKHTDTLPAYLVCSLWDKAAVQGHGSAGLTIPSAPSLPSLAEQPFQADPREAGNFFWNLAALMPHQVPHWVFAEQAGELEGVRTYSIFCPMGRNWKDSCLGSLRTGTKLVLWHVL